MSGGSRNHRPKPTETDYIAKILASSNVGSVGNYTLGKTLGEGSFGKVKLGVHKFTGQEVAIKVVDKIHAPTLVREIETWRHLHHPNIAQLYEVLMTESRIYMVTELCTGGEAFDYICENGRLDDRAHETRRIFREIVEAVGYCHDKNVVHRDLKLENILLTDDLSVKLIDFGFTREFTDRDLLDTYCGSVAYAAPEMITGKKYSGPQADIWSLGVILYTLICGYLPFDDDNEMLVHKKITELDYETPAFLSPVSVDLISSILILDPSSRLTIPAILNHAWFRDDADPSAPAPTPTGGKTPLGTTPEESTFVMHLEALGMDVEGILGSVHTNACDQASALWYLLLQKHRTAIAHRNHLLEQQEHHASGSSRASALRVTLSDSTITMTTNTTSHSLPRPRSHTPSSGSSSATSSNSASPFLASAVAAASSTSSSSTPTHSPSHLVSSSSSATAASQITMEQYLENARRRKSMPAEMGFGMQLGALQGFVGSSSSDDLLGGSLMGPQPGRRGVMMEAMRAGSLARVRNGARYGRRATWARGATPGFAELTSGPGRPLVGRVGSPGAGGDGATPPGSISGGDVSSGLGPPVGKTGSRQILEESEGEDSGPEIGKSRAATASRNRFGIGVKPSSGGSGFRTTSAMAETATTLNSPDDDAEDAPIIEFTSSTIPRVRNTHAGANRGAGRSQASTSTMTDLKRPKSSNAIRATGTAVLLEEE